MAADECELHRWLDVVGNDRPALLLGQSRGSGCGENRQAEPHVPMLRA